MASPSAGEVKLKTNVKDADVFIDGALAGKAAKLKSIRLTPRAYTVEVRAPGYTAYTSQIYVLAGKTIQLQAQLAPVPKS